MGLRKNSILAGAVLGVLVAVPLAPALDAAPRKSSGLKQAGSELGKLGREIGQAGKEAALEIAGAAKQVFYKGKKVSAPLLRDVQDSTREFWAEVLDEKDRTIEQLREENDELRRRLAENDD